MSELPIPPPSQIIREGGFSESLIRAMKSFSEWWCRFFHVTKVGTWLVYIDDTHISFNECQQSLVYNQVVQVIALSHFDGKKIIDIGCRFKDPTHYTTYYSGVNVDIPGQGIRWFFLKRFRVATPAEVHNWLYQHDPTYSRDQKIENIFKK